MAQRVVRLGSVFYIDPSGQSRRGQCGETIDVHDDYVHKFDPYNALFGESVQQAEQPAGDATFEAWLEAEKSWGVDVEAWLGAEKSWGADVEAWLAAEAEGETDKSDAPKPAAHRTRQRNANR